MGEAERRLATDEIGWLTTVAPDGRPQSSPVWFLWEDGAVLVASEPSSAKVANVAVHPVVAFHLEGAGPGDLVVTLEATATVGGPMSAAYGEKYAAGLARLDTTLDAYLGGFSATVRLTPTRLRSFRST